MSLDITKHLETLCQKDPDERRKAVASVLDSEEISYQTQVMEASPQIPRGICNYLFSTGEDAPGILFCAHYDSFPGSYGANDNAAGVCILIQLAKFFQEHHITAQFALFDGEENKNAGSKFYLSTASRSHITGAINLDVCGYGSHLVIYGKGHERKKVFAPFCRKDLLQKHQGVLVNFLPPSDDVSFTEAGIPALSIAAVPYWDIQYLKTLGTYGNGILGKPPEFDMILGEMDVMSTLHGGYKDSPEWIEPEAMELIFNFLAEAVTAPPVEKSKFSSSFIGGLFK